MYPEEMTFAVNSFRMKLKNRVKFYSLNEKKNFFKKICLATGKWVTTKLIRTGTAALVAGDFHSNFKSKSAFLSL